MSLNQKYTLETYSGRPLDGELTLLRTENYNTLDELLSASKYDVFGGENGSFDQDGVLVALSYAGFVTYKCAMRA